MRQIRSEAIILRRTNYGEADRIVNFITPKCGKISAVAKGVRKPKSKLAGSLELLAVCDVNVTYSSSNNMGVVTSAKLVEFFGNIIKHYDRLQLAYAFMKDVNRVSEMVSDEEFYKLLRCGLEYLNYESVDLRTVELWFDLVFVDLVGRSINLNIDIRGDDLRQGENYNYDFQENAFIRCEGGRFGSDHIKFLRLLRAKNPLLLKQVGGVDHVIEDCLWLARVLIGHEHLL